MGTDDALTSSPSRLRRADDVRKLVFRQRTAQYSMASIAVITLALFLLTADIGRNTAEILTWIVIGHVIVVATVCGFKSWEMISQLKNPSGATPTNGCNRDPL